MHLRIEMFVRNLVESREFYRKLPDSLCSSEKLSAGNYDVCWNGTALGEYTGTVPDQEDYSIQVTDNPEVSIPESKHAVLLTVAERLDNMTKILRGRVIPRQPTPARSEERTADRRFEMSGSGSGAPSGDDYDDDDDDVISSGSTDEPEVSDLTTQKGVGEVEEEHEEKRGFTASTDFIFPEKSTRKSHLPHLTRSAPGIAVTFTYTVGAGSTLLRFCDAGSLLLLTLSTLVLLRIV